MVKNLNNICFLSGDITRSGGTEKVACQIMSGLVDSYNVYVLSIFENDGQTFFELSQKVERKCLFKKKVNMKKDYFRIVTRLRHFVKKYEIDILIDIDTVLDMYSVPALIGLKPKLISWEHFNFYETMGTKIRMPLRKYITRFSDCVVTLTKEDKKAYREYFGKRHKIVQIYNPFDMQSSANNYNLDSKTIISAGRLTYQKGFDMLIDVAQNVFEKHPDWEWIILGEGEDRELLEKKIEDKKIEQIKLLGRVDNVCDYMKNGALFVLTSRYEGLGIVILEAKNSLLPVVSFDCKMGPEELIEDGVNGYLIDCFDIDEMSKKIVVLIEDVEKRKCFSDKALVNTNKFSYKLIINKWIDLLSKI